MKLRMLLCAPLAAALGLSAADSALAQRPPQSPPRAGVAVVETATVMQKSVRFNQEMETIKRENEAAIAALKKESDNGNALTEKFRKLPPDHPDRNRLEKDLLKMRSDFDLHGKRLNDQIAERKLRAMLAFSREMNEEVARYAKANNLSAVFRKDVSPTEFNDGQSIMQEVQKWVLYERELDITPAIIDAMNRRASAPTAGRPQAPPPTATQPQPPRR